jgi:hypothetical protein
MSISFVNPETIPFFFKGQEEVPFELEQLLEFDSPILTRLKTNLKYLRNNKFKVLKINKLGKEEKTGAEVKPKKKKGSKWN